MFYNGNTFRAFEQWYEYAKTNFIAPSEDPIPPEWVTMYYDPLVDLNHTIPAVFGWLMWGFYLLPNDPAMATRFYEAIKREYLIEKPDGTAHVILVPGATDDHQYMTVRMLAMANELGDTETVKKLQAHVEARYEPTWDRDAGEFYYGFGLNEPYPRGQYNANLMVPEVGGPGSWSRMFTDPNLEKFDQPTVYGVDFPSVGLSQAYYDQEKKTLVLQTYIADPAATGRPTNFRIKNLQQPDACRVLIDGQPCDTWTVQDGEIEISTEIGARAFHIIEG
jgi:hypothetical protein